MNWRPTENDIQDDTGAGGECLPAWHRYLLAIELAKVRNEIAPTFQEWANANGIEAQYEESEVEPAAAE